MLPLRQKKDDLPSPKIKRSFKDFLELLGIGLVVVIPFWILYDSIWFSDVIIWYIEWLGE